MEIIVDGFAFFRGYIVTANADGSIPLNAKIVCRVPDDDLSRELLAVLLARANRPFVEVLTEFVREPVDAIGREIEP